MQLSHIPLDRLSVSPANMRSGKKPPDITDLLPSVRARGVLVPLLIRANGTPDTYEIVAGRRRYHAALALSQERNEADEGEGAASVLPCAILDESDDAAAVEASLIENVARLDPDEVTRWETFTRLVAEGRSVEKIAATFGLDEPAVKRTLALGNLHPRIRRLYADGKIDAASVRHLTMAPLTRQKDWLALARDPEARAPVGQQLKAWLLGGASISTSVALFDLADYPGEIVSDLFGEERYFADAATFWHHQNAAIEARAAACREAGWSGVEIMEPGRYFQRWEHEKVARTKGGKVFITVSHRGEVEVHEGWLSRREAQRLARGEEGKGADKPARPEITSAMQTYVDLHRHAAVRASLADHPAVALRLAVAHMIAGSPLWNVRVEPQRAANDAIAESVETSPFEAAFDANRRLDLGLIGFDPEAPTIVGGQASGETVAHLFARLLRLSDEEVLRILAVVMGETLDAASAATDAVGLHLGADLAGVWEADEAFFDGLRDKEVLHAVLREVADPAVAEANKGERGKAMKAIIRDCLAGANGRAKVENWVPGWLAFPARGYTQRGGVNAVARCAEVVPLLAADAS
jgi:ParB family chromosome partitioning protein